MKKKLKPQTVEKTTQASILHRIPPLPVSRISFVSGYDYYDKFEPNIHLKTNPKWTKLDIYLGYHSEMDDLVALRRIKSLRVIALHFADFQQDSQCCGDRLHPYLSTLRPIENRLKTLKRLRLMIATRL